MKTDFKFMYVYSCKACNLKYGATFFKNYKSYCPECGKREVSLHTNDGVVETIEAQGKWDQRFNN